MKIIPDEERCQQSVADPGGWHSHRCGNRAKGEADGKRLCGIHLAAINRAEARRAEWDKGYAADRRYVDQVKALVAEYDVDVQPYYRAGTSGRDSGYVHHRVVVNLEWLEALLKERANT